MAETIFRGYPKFRAIPWSRGLYLASHLPRILSIPKLALILLLNPKSWASNKGNRVSRKTHSDPLFSCFLPLHYRLKIDSPTLTQTTTLFAKQIVDEANVFITCNQAFFFFRGERQATKKNKGRKTILSQLTVFILYFRSFPAKLQFPFYVI